MKGRELPAKRQFFEIFLEKFGGGANPVLFCRNAPCFMAAPS